MSEINSAVANNNDSNRTSDSSSPPTMTNPTTDSCSLIPQSVPPQLPSSSSSSNNISAAVQQQILLQHWTQQLQQQQQEHQQSPSLLPQSVPSIMSQPPQEQSEQQHHSYPPASTTTNHDATHTNAAASTTPIPIVSSIAPLTHSQPPSIPQSSHYHQPPATMTTTMMNKETSSSLTYQHQASPATNDPAASTTTATNLYPTSSQLQQQQQQQHNNAILSQQWTAFLQQQQQQQKNPSQQPQQQPLIGNLVMIGQPSPIVPIIMNNGMGGIGNNSSNTDGHGAQQQPTMSISVQQQQLILQQLLANVMVAQQQQGQISQQPVISNPVTGVSQQFIMNPFQHGMNYPVSNNSSNVSSNIAPFSATGSTAVAAAGSPPAMLSPVPTMHAYTAQPQPLPQSNASATIRSKNTVNNSDNKKNTNVDEIGTHTFNEGWKTMWDDEDDVDVDILDDPRTATVATTSSVQQQQNVAAAPTPSVAANDVADDEDWAPTPLSEIQAKQLKRQFVPSDTATIPNKRHNSTLGGGGGGNSNTNNNQGLPVPISSSTVTTTGSVATNVMLPPPTTTSQDQPSVLQQLQMSYLQQQSNLYQPSQHQPVPAVSNNNNNNIGTVHQHSVPNHQPTVPPFLNNNGNSNSNSSGSSVLQPQLFGHKISTRLISPQQRQLPPQHHDKSALQLQSAVTSPSVLASALPVGARDPATSGGSVDTATSKTTLDHTGMIAGSNPPNNIKYPSVTPMTSATANHKSKNVMGGGRGKPSSAVPSSSSRLELPQDYLERIITLRGFIVKPGCRNDRARQSIRIKAEQSGYDTTPSPLQLASFGTELVKAVHESDIHKLHLLLLAGLSPNPCNQFSDSIVDLVCKRSKTEIFQCLVDHGCDLRVCDGFGRTPLHHCCWAFEFNPDIVTLILQSDPQQLFMEDKRGQTPLEYVRPDQAADWIRFLKVNANTFFPTGGSLAPIVSLKQIRVNGHVADPPNALPVQLATAISSGSITPEELEQMDPVLRARFS